MLFSTNKRQRHHVVAVCVVGNMRELTFTDAYLSKTHRSRYSHTSTCSLQHTSCLPWDLYSPSDLTIRLSLLTNLHLSTTNSDWPALPSTTTTTTNNIMSTVLSLPTELLCQIADFVDSTDLSNMRLVCKPLRDAANMPFGIAYIKNRHHVLTQKSIEALLEIVAHPAFGAYVDSISVFPLFPTAWTVPSLNQSGLVAYVKSRSHMQLMKQVFIKIRENQNSVHINICDAASNMSGYGCAEMLDSGSVLHPCPTETLENTLLAAIRANCHVRSLELSMHQHKFIDLQEALEDLLSPTRPPLRLIIHCPRKRTRVLHCPYTITYNQADHSLKLDGCDVYELAAAKEGSSIKRLLGFLLAQTTQLILERCHLCSAFASFLALDKTGTLAQNLTSVHMLNFRP